MPKDFTNSKIAPVLVCFVRHKDKFLLLKRSDKVLAYKNLWSTLAGFIDDNKKLKDKIVEEITEELGLAEKDIQAIKPCGVYNFKDKEINREWIRHLFVADISNPKIKIDWEHTDYKWIEPKEIDRFKTTPGLAKDIIKVK